MLNAFRMVWNYRGIVLGAVKREFQSRYLNSLLGASWTVIQPLAMILVYTLVFSQVMNARLPGAESVFGYSIYLCAGILTWGLFSELLGRNISVFLDNANLIKKIQFPRLCLPIIVVSVALLNFAIILALFLAFLLLTGSFPGWVLLAILPALLVQVLFAVSLGIALGVLNVFFRDVGQFMAVVLQFWFWMTPIVYPISILPAAFQQVVAWNPMTPMVTIYQTVFVAKQMPSYDGLIYPAVLTLLLCVWAIRVYRRHLHEMVDEL